MSVTSVSTDDKPKSACRAAGITLNRNVVPDDTNGPWYTSGLRLGTPAVTTLGMRADEMREIGEVLAAVLRGASPGVITSGPNQGKPSLVQFRLDEKIQPPLGPEWTTSSFATRSTPGSSSDGSSRHTSGCRRARRDSNPQPSDP